MLLFELLIALLLGGAILTAVANRIGAPYPVLLALAGTALAIAPVNVPGVQLDPDLALTLFRRPGNPRRRLRRVAARPPRELDPGHESRAASPWP